MPVQSAHLKARDTAAPGVACETASEAEEVRTLMLTSPETKDVDFALAF